MPTRSTRSEPSAQWARACWAASEPFTVSMFFTPEAAAIAERAGLPGRAAYIVLRAAPLDAAAPAVAASTFRSFPAPVFAVLGEAWKHLCPQAAIDAHHEAVQQAATRRLGDPSPELADVADQLTEAVQHLDTSGRPLAAARPFRHRPSHGPGCGGRSTPCANTAATDTSPP